jgi:hypothetical protein
MTTLAEKLRAWVEAREQAHAVEQEIRESQGRMFSGEEVRDYLSGHDDAKAESAEEIAVLREEGKRLTARVRELEATLLDEHSRRAQEEAKPAAVGVVGDVLGYTNLYEGRRFGGWYATAQDAKQGSLTGAPRVVAIVDPAQIVPLASGEPVRWLGERPGFKYIRDTQEEIASIGVDTVTPLYPGLAQNAQEGEG